MSRIIAGAAGGVRLASVPGDNTRPTTDRVKESLFSKLESYDLLRDARVLDAFGGSGALGCSYHPQGIGSIVAFDHGASVIGTAVIAHEYLKTGVTCLNGEGIKLLLM